MASEVILNITQPEVARGFFYSCHFDLEVKPTTSLKFEGF